jgi:hypothetical protein
MQIECIFFVYESKMTLPASIIRIILDYNLDEIFQHISINPVTTDELDWFMSIILDPVKRKSLFLDCCREGKIQIVDYFRNNYRQIFERYKIEGFYESNIEGIGCMIEWFLINGSISMDDLNQRFYPRYETVLDASGSEVRLITYKKYHIDGNYRYRETTLDLSNLHIKNWVKCNDVYYDLYQTKINAGMILAIIILMFVTLYRG